MKEELEELVGVVDRLTPVHRGYTPAERYVVSLFDGGSVFAKRAVDAITADWLRKEHQMYQALSGRHIAPELVGWIEGDLPILVLEDVSNAVWPPPWNRNQIELVHSVLGSVAKVVPPEGLPSFADQEQPNEGWDFVLADPGQFLALGLCDASWLDRVGPDLLAAATSAPLAGSSLVHNDVRSDNLCIHSGSALLIDWNLACIGNPQFDVAFWIPSLARESGLSPEELMPDCPAELAAYVAGFFASRAGQPLIPRAPLVRQAQLQQLQVALPWAARALGVGSS
jgi:Phosphotransferase enzyme family